MKSVSYSFLGKKFSFRTDDTFCDHVIVTVKIVYIRVLISFSVPAEVSLSGAGSVLLAQSLCGPASGEAILDIAGRFDKKRGERFS